MAANLQKLKLLYLMKMFAERTDEEHGLSMAKLLEGLAEYGITAERKSVYRDIEALREFGFDIRSFNRAPVEYAFVSRSFALEDLLLAIDAVQSCEQLTQRKADAISRGLKGLLSTAMREQAIGRLSVPGRVAVQSDSVLPKVDRAKEAISKKRLVTFRVFRYDAAKEKVACGEERFMGTPVELSCSRGRYYLIADEAGTAKRFTFRLDLIDYLEILPDAAADAAPADRHAPEALENLLRGAEGTRAVEAQLIVADGAIGAVIDRFGADVDSSPQPDGTALVNVEAVAGPLLYGWLASLGGAVKVVSPASLAQGYRAHLQACLAAAD